MNSETFCDRSAAKGVCRTPVFATAPRFYAVSRELRKLRRVETTRRCRLAISQPPDILYPATGWLSIVLDRLQLFKKK